MHSRTLVAIVVALSFAPVAAEAATYNLHVSGVCSYNWTDSLGSQDWFTDDTMGYWAGETSISASVNQTSSMSTAVADLKTQLDTYCLNGNLCYIYAWSNGGAVMSKVLATYDTAWNIGYIYTSSNNEGGSELASGDWLSEFLAGCSLASYVRPGNFRTAWNHNDTNGKVFYQVAGDIGPSWALWYATSGLLPGDDDGIVALHSAGGATCGGSSSGCSVTNMCSAARWSNHSIVGTCYGYSLDHAAMKRKAICNDGGGGNCP
jgi:hypothetical protein